MPILPISLTQVCAPEVAVATPHLSRNRSLSGTLNTALAAIKRAWSSWISLLMILVSSSALVAQSTPHPIMAPAHISPEQATRSHHVSIRRFITGTDGSQTGTAPFLGNFTQISAPSQSYFLLQRQADCSLTLYTGTGTGSASGTFTITGETPHYEKVLHQLASLTTTPDVFAHGCASSSLGVGSHIAAYAGLTPANIAVVAGAVLYDANTDTQAIAAVNVDVTHNLFQTHHYTAAALNNATALTTADLNDDGIGDLVIVSANLATIATVNIMLGNADGTFQTPVSYTVPGLQTAAVAADDLNGDGKLDLVVVSNFTPGTTTGYQQISVLLGNGDGTFQAAQSFNAPSLPGFTNESSTPIVNLITADLRGTGKRDIVCSNGLVLLSNGDGTFTTAPTAAFPYVFDTLSSAGPNLASGDLNNDGKPDLVVDDGLSISIFYGKGDATFTQGPSYASINNSSYVSISDVDGDGNPDIYTGIANGGLYSGDDSSADGYILMGRGDGTFSGAPILSNGTYVGNNLVDLNGDGILDLVSNATGEFNTPGTSFLVQLGTGKGTFTPFSTVTPPATFTLNGINLAGFDTSSTIFALGDINGDNKLDLVFIVTGSIGNGTYVYPYPVLFTAFGNGDGTFQTPVPQLFPQIAPSTGYDISVATKGLQIADFNRDNHADLIVTFNEVGGGTGVTNPYNQGFVVLPGKGDGSFMAPIITSTYSSSTAPTSNYLPTVNTVADLNKDNKPDLVVLAPSFSVATGYVEPLEIYLGNDDGTFKAPTTVATATNPVAVVLADFNKDGKLDLASIGQTASVQGQLAVSLGNGDGTFNTPTILALAGYPGNGLAAGDFNADGNVDLAVISPEGYSGVFYGNGTGVFSSIDIGSGSVPTDLIDLFVSSGAAVATDLNKDGKTDILINSTTLINISGAAPTLQAGSRTSLKTSSTTITAGSGITLTATVASASGSGTPTGSVTFYSVIAQNGNGQQANSLGTANVTSGTAALTTTALPAGVNALTAVYTGDANFSTSASAIVNVTVSAAQTVTTTTALTPSATSASSGTSITFTAHVTSSSGTATPTGSVTFSDGNSTLGSGTLNSSGNATYSTSNLSVGTHSVTASYAGSTGFASSISSAVSVTITAAVPASFTLALAPTSGTTSGGSSITTIATVTPSGGFNAAVSLTCSGVPQFSTCIVNPTSVTPSGVVSSTVTINTNVQSASLGQHPQSSSTPTSPISLACLAGGVLFALSLKHRRRAGWVQLGVLLLLVSAACLSACGGGSHSSGGSGNKTPAGTYTLTVTGTSGSIAQVATYSLTVQ